MMKLMMRDEGSRTSVSSACWWFDSAMPLLSITYTLLASGMLRVHCEGFDLGPLNQSTLLPCPKKGQHEKMAAPSGHDWREIR